MLLKVVLKCSIKNLLIIGSTNERHPLGIDLSDDVNLIADDTNASDRNANAILNAHDDIDSVVNIEEMWKCKENVISHIMLILNVSLTNHEITPLSTRPVS